MDRKISIPADVIAQINSIAPDVLQSRGVLSLAKDGKSYVCPNCGNGTGKSGDGMVPSKSNEGAWLYHCFSCGAGYNNLKLLAAHYELDVRNDFGEICRRACQDFNISLETDARYPYRNFKRVEKTQTIKNMQPVTISATPAKAPDTAELERKEREMTMIRADISEAQKNIDKLPENSRRGLTIDTLRHFGCGYLPVWRAPKAVVEGKNPPSSRRFIVPTSERHYLAAALLEDRPTMEKRWYKMHAGSKEVFNSAALADDGVIIIVEGEIDAMSIWQATNGEIPVIAIGGAAEDNWVDSVPESAQFLILFDNDETGKRDAVKLQNTLKAKGYLAAIAFLSDSGTKLDANDILSSDNGSVALANKVRELITEAQADLEKAAADIADLKVREEKIVEWTADNGDINPAVMERLKIDVAYLKGLTLDKITASAAAESKTLRAVANCRFYDFYRDVAESFMARVDTARAEAQGKIKKSSIENPVDSFVRELAAVPARSKLEDSIAKLVTEIGKAHKQYQKKLAAQREIEEANARRAEKQQALTQAEARLEELKAMAPSFDRDEEMRAIIADMCDWKEDLRGNKIAVRSTAANYKRIFTSDPVLDGLFGYDEFQQSDVFLKPAPWKKKFILHEPWQDSDDSALRVYLRETYTELANEKLCADYLSVYSRKRSFHVVQDWLNNLPAWDGVARAETVFIDYLKVEDSAFAREVTMNWLTGALARIFYPGCEYQTALVLNGAQGIGKSGITKMLGSKWHVALKDSVEDSHAIDVVQTGWIVEIEEFWAGSKAEVSALKAFISASADDRRAAYARRAQKALRHCAFVITCNDEQFLKDVTGNRRFLILHCNAERLDNSAIKQLTPEIIEQIWAETLYKFRQQFPTDEDFDTNKLELSQATRIQAENIAQHYMYDDGLVAEIGSFLDRKIPHAHVWEKLTKEQRRKFVVDNYIELDQIETTEMLKDLPDFAQDEILNTASIIEIPTGNSNYITRYRFRGVRDRTETCAAEIFNECFGNDNRKKIRRINEILPTLAGWVLLTKADGKEMRRKNFAACYGDQKRIYFRVDNPHEESQLPIV